MQTVKFARVRLARFDGVRVYSFEMSWNIRPTKRVGVYGKGH